MLSLAVLALFVASCDPQKLAQEAGGTRRISIATGGMGGVYYPYGGGIAKLVTDELDGVVARLTEQGMVPLASFELDPTEEGEL